MEFKTASGRKFYLNFVSTMIVLADELPEKKSVKYLKKMQFGDNTVEVVLVRASSKNEVVSVLIMEAKAQKKEYSKCEYHSKEEMDAYIRNMLFIYKLVWYCHEEGMLKNPPEEIIQSVSTLINKSITPKDVLYHSRVEKID